MNNPNPITKLVAALAAAVWLPLGALYSTAAPITIPLQQATADLSQPGYTVDRAIDGVSADGNGWAVSSGVGQPHAAVFETQNDLNFNPGSALTFKLFQAHGSQHTLGRFRLSVTSDPRDSFADGLQDGGDVQANWIVLTPTVFSSQNGATLTKLGDDSILVSGVNPNTDVYTVIANLTLTNITGFRVEALTNASLAFGGPGRQPNGNFVLTELQVEVENCVTSAPPHVVTPPLTQGVYEGRNVTLAVLATGACPLTYQWQRHGTNLTGATNNSLLLSNMGASQSGSYQVIITNSVGSVTSQVAVLTVLPPPQLSLLLSTNFISEGAKPAIVPVTLARDADWASEVTVMLTSSDQTAITVPTSVILPAGSNSVTFALQVVNDGEVDGTQTVSVSAAAPLYVGGSAALQVANDDSPAERTLGGTLSGTIAQSDYRVLSDLVVPAGQSLTIEPGTILLFETNTALTVFGTLIATGGPSSKIIFTCSASNAVPGSWNGISVIGGGPRTLLDQVEIAFATTGLGISGVNPQVTLTKGEVHHCSAGFGSGIGVAVYASPGTYIGPSDVAIAQSSIHHCDFAVWIDAFANNSGASANPTVEENDIFHNRYGIIARANGAFFTSGYADASGKITRNALRENTNAAIGGYALAFRTGVSASFINNLIINNLGNGIELSGSGSPILNNTIVGNGGSGLSHSSYGGFFQNNIVVSNQVGVQSTAPFTPFAGQFAFNDVALNASGNWSNFPPAFGSATATNFNGTPADSENNISVNPQFASSSNFQLLATSPAVNAGTTNLAPGIDLDGHPRFAPFDIGAYELQPRFQFGAPTRQSNGLLQWPVAVQAAHVFTIQSSTNLNTWNNVAVVTNNGGKVTFSTYPTNSTFGFFRAVP